MTDKIPKTYTLIGADGKPFESETKGTLGGHRKDKIYGTLNCKGAARWIAKDFYVKQRVFSPTNKRQSPPDTDLASDVCAKNIKDGKRSDKFIIAV